jgi:hypothetical protein
VVLLFSPNSQHRDNISFTCLIHMLACYSAVNTPARDRFRVRGRARGIGRIGDGVRDR